MSLNPERAAVPEKLLRDIKNRAEKTSQKLGRQIVKSGSVQTYYLNAKRRLPSETRQLMTEAALRTGLVDGNWPLKIGLVVGHLWGKQLLRRPSPLQRLRDQVAFDEVDGNLRDSLAMLLKYGSATPDALANSAYSAQADEIITKVPTVYEARLGRTVKARREADHLYRGGFCYSAAESIGYLNREAIREQAITNPVAQRDIQTDLSYLAIMPVGQLWPEDVAGDSTH